MACPYLPAAPGAYAWTPEHLRMAGVQAAACPGYTTALPSVAEVVEAYPHWENGTLRDVLGGAPSPALLAGLVALKGGIRERDDAQLAERSKGGK